MREFHLFQEKWTGIPSLPHPASLWPSHWSRAPQERSASEKILVQRPDGRRSWGSCQGSLRIVGSVWPEEGDKAGEGQPGEMEAAAGEATGTSCKRESRDASAPRSGQRPPCRLEAS